LRRFALLMALALPLAGAACENPNTADEVVPLRIEDVDVLVLESFPVQIMAVVTGTLPTACSSIESVSQTRQGNVVEVTITTRTERDQVCIQVIKQITERIRLEGGFPPGDYVLRVNGLETRFRV
jgi:inhibitor of cysteine peptidase